LSGLLTAVKF